MKKISLFAVALCCLTITPHIHSAAEAHQEREVASPVSLNGDANGGVEVRENVAPQAPLSPRNQEKQSNNEEESQVNALRAAARLARQGDDQKLDYLGQPREGDLFVNQEKADCGEFLDLIRMRQAEQAAQERLEPAKPLSEKVASAANTVVYLVVDNTIRGARAIADAAAVKAQGFAAEAVKLAKHQQRVYDQKYFTPRPPINGNEDDLPGAGEIIEVGYPAAVGLKSKAHPIQRQVSLDDEKS